VFPGQPFGGLEFIPTNLGFGILNTAFDEEPLGFAASKNLKRGWQGALLSV
jgi:hypothetical protein